MAQHQSHDHGHQGDVLVGPQEDQSLSLVLLDLSKDMLGPYSRTGRAKVLHAQELLDLELVCLIGFASPSLLQPL